MKNPEKLPMKTLGDLFDIPLPWDAIPVSGGLIHRTYQLRSEIGVFSLQALHPKLSSDEILCDFDAVTKHLQNEGFPAPRLIKTLHGDPAADVDGTRWRLTTWLHGETKTEVANEETAYHAAKLLGRFHKVMESIDHEFKSRHPLHDTEFHVSALENTLDRFRCEQINEIDSETFKWIEKLSEETLGRLSVINREFQNPPLPKRVVHGDPKISNIIFHPGKAEAVGLIDLDTCARHTVLVDLGDAIRSWTPTGPEERSGGFRTEILEALLDGYQTSGFPLTQEEKGRIALAGPLITWELCARFVRDVMEDSYFGWDPAEYPSRRAHNIVRAKSMAELGRRLEQASIDI